MDHSLQAIAIAVGLLNSLVLVDIRTRLFRLENRAMNEARENSRPQMRAAHGD